ncbi:MAG: TIR domain-containing protein [Ruminococcaceae bacterium]|nr:TIR domain-containing protein [Oscillospiraceae bacterium]
MALDTAQRTERSKYLKKNLTITECSQNKPYVFISYASDNWETVFKKIVVPFQKRYGLSVYSDTAFDKVNDSWLIPMLRNVRGADAVIAFVSQSYIESYACFLELMTAVNNKKHVVFVFLEEKLRRGDVNDRPHVERCVKNEILRQGANIATNANDTASDLMRAMKTAYISILTTLEQDVLSKYDISEAFLSFFRDASINRKSINDLDALNYTINSVSSDVFDKTLISEEKQGGKTYNTVTKSKTEAQNENNKETSAAAEADNKPTYVENISYIFVNEITYKEFPGTYTGKWYNNKPCGEGIMTFLGGDIYDGEWKDGKIDGNGTYTFLSGNVYKGEFKDNEINGQGTFNYFNGDVCEGNFKNGRRDGKCVYNFSNGDVFEGYYEDDKMNHGILKFSSGAVFEGDFKDDKMNYGTFKYTSGEVYEGEFKYGQRNGHGIFKYTNGEVYEGEFKDNKYNGHGIMKYLNGNVYEGEFRDDKKHGKGTLTFADGTVQTGEWQNGKFIG